MWHSINEVEKKPEIIETIESNYRIARRVYQQLYIDISVLFADFIRSMDSFEIHDMDNDIKANEWAIKKITDVNDAEDFMTIPNFLSNNRTAPSFKRPTDNSRWRCTSRRR